MGWQDDDRPPPSQQGAVFLKLCEIAEEHFGCLPPAEAAEWREWLAGAKGYAMGRSAGAAKHCSLCGQAGHLRTTCKGPPAP